MLAGKGLARRYPFDKALLKRFLTSSHLEWWRRSRLRQRLLSDVLWEVGLLEGSRSPLAVPHKPKTEGGAPVLPGEGEAEREGHAEHAARIDLVDGACSPRGVAQLHVSNLRGWAERGVLGACGVCLFGVVQCTEK